MAQATIEQNGSMAPSQGGQGSRKAKLGLLPTASTAVEVNYRGKVIEETTWAQLPHNTVFSVNSDGSHPYLKLAKSRYLNLVTSDVVTSVPANAQQKVYRVSLT